MIVINNIDSQRFTFNGVEYFKNFTPIVVGTKIRILNTYDSTIELTDSPRLFSEFEVDGLTYASVILLQGALLPILYSRNTLGGGGGAWGSITGTLSDQIDLQSALDSKQDTLTPVNVGEFMDVDLATKLTPSPNDTILGRDFLTNEAVEFNYPIVEGYFNGTNFYLEAGFVNLITATTGRTYIDLTTNLQYRWSGSNYVQIGGGKRTMYLFFPIFQNVTASTSWYALPSTGQIFTGTGYTANAALTDANDFADLSYLTPRLFVPFQHKVKSVSIHGSSNTTAANPVQFAVVTSYVSTANSGATTIPNPLIVAQEGITIYQSGSANGFQKKFDDVNLDTSTLNAGTDYRILFKNANEASNIQRAMLIVEVEEVL